MNIHYENSQVHPHYEHFISNWHAFCDIPIESLAFFAASIAMRIFIPSFSAPLLGIGISLATSRLVLKIMDRYDGKASIDLTKEVCKLNRKYPKLQLIAFVFSLAISLLSRALGFIAGAIVGSCGAIILDVENFRLAQQARRKSMV